MARTSSLTCDCVEAKLSGSSRKFDCGAVLATHLLWALGFGADPRWRA
jgi:hypothetical protein